MTPYFENAIKSGLTHDNAHVLESSCDSNASLATQLLLLGYFLKPSCVFFKLLCI